MLKYVIAGLMTFGLLFGFQAANAAAPFTTVEDVQEYFEGSVDRRESHVTDAQYYEFALGKLFVKLSRIDTEKVLTGDMEFVNTKMAIEFFVDVITDELSYEERGSILNRFSRNYLPLVLAADAALFTENGEFAEEEYGDFSIVSFTVFQWLQVLNKMPVPAAPELVS